MEAMQKAGLGASEVHASATIVAARAAGIAGETGSIEAGKRADLIVLDADPLASIRNSTSIRYVLVNGRIYDAATLAQLGNHAAPPPRRNW